MPSLVTKRSSDEEDDEVDEDGQIFPFATKADFEEIKVMRAALIQRKKATAQASA